MCYSPMGTDVIRKLMTPSLKYIYLYILLILKYINCINQTLLGGFENYATVYRQ